MKGKAIRIVSGFHFVYWTDWAYLSKQNFLHGKNMAKRRLRRNQLCGHRLAKILSPHDELHGFRVHNSENVQQLVIFIMISVLFDSFVFCWFRMVSQMDTFRAGVLSQTISICYARNTRGWIPRKIECPVTSLLWCFAGLFDSGRPWTVNEHIFNIGPCLFCILEWGLVWVADRATFSVINGIMRVISGSIHLINSIIRLSSGWSMASLG